MIVATLSIFSCTKDGLYDEPYFSRIDTVYIDNTVEEEEEGLQDQDYHDTDFYNDDEDVYEEKYEEIISQLIVC